jgi:hypothetical protein
MSQQKKNAPSATKPPKKLIPRTAPKAAPTAAVEPLPEVAEVVAPGVASTPAPVVEAVATTAKAARKPRASKPATKAVPVIADAAPVATIKQPLGKPAKAEKAQKARKAKLVRDSYAMPEAEYAQIGLLKKRLAGLGNEVKKSELLRGGIATLAALNDAELKAIMGRIERIKTGRPAK